MIAWSPITRLKADARLQYKRFHGLLDQYDCGKHMLKEVCPAAADAAAKYNAAMTELRRIDPECPEFIPL